MSAELLSALGDFFLFFFLLLLFARKIDSTPLPRERHTAQLEGKLRDRGDTRSAGP
jgi:hypothetical protein